MFKAVSLALLLAGAPVIDTPVVDGVEITQVLEHYPVTGNNAQEGGGVHFLSETGSEPDPLLQSDPVLQSVTEGGYDMTRILFVGQEPETVDLSDPAIPPGLDAAKINAGIEIAVASIAERGWKVDVCMIPPDERADPCWRSNWPAHATTAW